jgi:hypothetical protein
MRFTAPCILGVPPLLSAAALSLCFVQTSGPSSRRGSCCAKRNPSVKGTPRAVKETLRGCHRILPAQHQAQPAPGATSTRRNQHRAQPAPGATSTRQRSRRARAWQAGALPHRATGIRRSHPPCIALPCIALFPKHHQHSPHSTRRRPATADPQQRHRLQRTPAGPPSAAVRLGRLTHRRSSHLPAHSQPVAASQPVASTATTQQAPALAGLLASYERDACPASYDPHPAYRLVRFRLAQSASHLVCAARAHPSTASRCAA